MFNFKGFYSRKVNEIVHDSTTIADGDCKEIRQWKWRKMKTEKLLVCNRDGQPTYEELEACRGN